MTGQFTVRDITREITLPVTFLGTAKDPWGNERIAFEAEYTLNRKDYGLTWNAALETGGFLVGDDVKITPVGPGRARRSNAHRIRQRRPRLALPPVAYRQRRPRLARAPATH